MKIFKYLMFFLLIGGMITSCAKDDLDDAVEGETELPGEEPDNDVSLEIKDFVWKGMNNIYLYKNDIPQLANDYFSTQTELNEYLESWTTPEKLFYEGLVSEQDRFSWIVDDYEELEAVFAGSNKSAGFKYGWAYAPGSQSQVVAYVIYVSPDGPADEAGLERGHYITEVNGTSITIDNYGSSLFAGDMLDLEVSTVEGGALVPMDDPISITKLEFKENTIPVKKVFTIDGVKIGYLYLSSFLGEFGVDDTKLNDAFGEFKAENIDELIVDLRYNQGGYSEFSADLGSMVTGQFEGEIFTQQRWNDMYQEYFEQEDPERLYNRFDSTVDGGEAINSLNLNNVYVIATGRSYSASESFIIGLEAYIDVIHVGTSTGGKFQGSVTLYDGDGFSKENVNPNHKYAIQPLVYKFANADGYTDFINGLTPDVVKEESVYGLGQLGDLDEPLLAEAIAAITGNRSFLSADEAEFKPVLTFPVEEKGYMINHTGVSEELPFKGQLFKK